MSTKKKKLNPMELLKEGDALWLVVNGEPGLRYYCHAYNWGHVLSFFEDLSHEVYYDSTLFYSCQAGVLNRIIEGLEDRLESDLLELQDRRQRLAACYIGKQ